MSLAQKALGGFFWTALNKFGSQGIQFVVLIVLARLLTPADFGLVAMLMVFFALSQNLISSGFAQALIREKKISEEDKSTTFFLNLFVAIIMYGILWVSAPAIAIFFEQPPLVDLTRFMALTLFFYSVTIVQRASFTQALKFKSMMYIEVSSAILTGLIAIVLAFMGYGVWALAVKFVAISLINSILFYIYSPWLPKSFINKKSLTKLFKFGSYLMIVSVMNTLYQNIYKIIIGKMYSATTLGFYTQALNFKDLFTKHIINSLQKVTYPILSKTYNDPRDLKNAVKKVLISTSFFIFPLVTGLIVCAESLILLTIGHQWIETILILQVICLSAAIYHIHAININVLKIIGRTDLYLRLAIIRKINVIFVIVAAFVYGFWALIIGQVVSSYIALFINSYYTSKYIKYSILDQVVDLLGVIKLAILMGGGMYLVTLYPFEIMLLEFISTVLVGIITYGLLCLYFKPYAMVLVFELLIVRYKKFEKYRYIWAG